MADEVLNDNTQQQTPQDNQPKVSYIDGVYANLEHAYGKDNVPDKNTFITKMQDKNYRDGIHKNLINAYGQDNVPDYDTFETKLDVKKKEQSIPSALQHGQDATNLSKIVGQPNGSQSQSTSTNKDGFDINSVVGKPAGWSE